MQSIDEGRLESDLSYRFRYLADFIGFAATDAAAIQTSAPFIGPMIPQIVERTYEKLLAFDATARHFVTPNAGFPGAPPANLEALSASHPQIQFRKEHLSRYFMQILGRTCDEKLVPYLDMVGKIHTPKAGNREIDIPLVQMNALMGFLADVLSDVILSLGLSGPETNSMLRAYQKLLWIQNDFITRHYQNSSSTS